jgi:hypothetical protein
MISWRLLLLIAVAAVMLGCTTADIHDPTYNTKQILLNDRRE